MKRGWQTFIMTCSKAHIAFPCSFCEQNMNSYQVAKRMNGNKIANGCTRKTARRRGDQEMKRRSREEEKGEIEKGERGEERRDAQRGGGLLEFAEFGGVK